MNERVFFTAESIPSKINIKKNIMAQSGATGIVVTA